MYIMGSRRLRTAAHDVHGAGVWTVRASFAASVVLSCAANDHSMYTQGV
jgi:hypothetical protein